MISGTLTVSGLIAAIAAVQALKKKTGVYGLNGKKNPGFMDALQYVDIRKKRSRGTRLTLLVFLLVGLTQLGIGVYLGVTAPTLGILTMLGSIVGAVLGVIQMYLIDCADEWKK